MEIKLLETAGWYTVFKNLRQSYSLDTRSECEYQINVNKYTGSQEGIYNWLNYSTHIQIEPRDMLLLSTLVKRGDSHSKIIRGLQTYVEITAPRYWWQEWITYCIGVLELNPTIDWVSLNSESTMHTLIKGVEFKDFENASLSSMEHIQDLLGEGFTLKTVKASLPEGYLQTRTYMVSYQAWRRIYQQRKDHKLEEWHKDIVEFIEELPFSKELITNNYGEDK